MRLFGTSDPVERLHLEQRMKKDKIPLTKKKREPKKPEDVVVNNRKKLGLKGTQSLSGMSTQEALEVPGTSLEELVKGAEVFQRHELDEMVSKWGSPEDILAQLPSAKQPEILQAILLPYQLQVGSITVMRDVC